MKFFIKNVFLFTFLLTAVSVVANPFDTDISDWSQDKSAACEDNDYNFFWLRHTVHLAQKKVGVKSPIVIVEGADNGLIRGIKRIVERAGDTSLEQTIQLSTETISRLNKPPFFRHGFYYNKALGTLYHEMGHAKYTDDPQFVRQITSLSHEYDTLKQKADSIEFTQANEAECEKITVGFEKFTNDLRQSLYNDELYADAAIPDKKSILLARAVFSKEHHKALFDVWGCPDKLKPSADIDFSQPMNEEAAQAWDQWHAEHEDIHPSSYRRSYVFYGRAKAIGYEQCKKFVKFVKQLTASDLAS